MGQVLRIDPLNADAAQIERIADVVREGGLIVYPTDTIYGLGCLPQNTRALDRICGIKQRAERKGLLLLVPNMEWVGRLCSEVPEVFHRLAAEFWPGPVTFLVPANLDLPLLVRGDRDLVGLRNPDCPYLVRLMSTIPGPIVSTSANVSGEEPSGDVQQLKRCLLHQVDLFVDGGDVDNPVPSTVVDLSVAPPRVVRPGRLGDRLIQALA